MCVLWSVNFMCEGITGLGVYVNLLNLVRNAVRTHGWQASGVAVGYSAL